MIKASLNWTFLIVGTVIGAGYASGRELWQFFGPESGLAIILFTFLFAISCYSIMIISFKKQSEHYAAILSKIVGGKTHKLFDIFIFVYLIATTVVMVAGSGAIGEIYDLSSWWGIFLLSISLMGIFSFNIEGFLSMNKIVIPVLILGLLFVLISFISVENVPLMEESAKQGNWFAAFPFTSLNILPLIAVLGAIGSKIGSKKEVLLSSMASGLILGVVTFIYNKSLVHIEEQVDAYEIPLFTILEGYSKPLFLFVTVMLWLAIFTTAASNMIGIVTRLREILDLKFLMIVFLTLLIIVPISKIGFSTLIHYLYPAYGVLNLYILAKLIVYPFIGKD